MRVLLSGATGFLGAKLAERLRGEGHEVVPLARRAVAGPAVAWNPADPGSPDSQSVAGFDTVVHLAGENIAAGRWTAARKAALRSSRVEATRNLADALVRSGAPPRIFLGASATGYYGSRGDELLDEASPPGAGFLPELCEAWEHAAQPLAAAGTRVRHARLGVVLDPAGGMLAKVAPLFRWGLGGRLGHGQQWFSWLGRDDAVAALLRLATDPEPRGAFNLTAPEPVTNAEFTRGLAKALGRWVGPPAPAFALRLALGEMADGLLLASARVAPRRLGEAGFAFADPTFGALLAKLYPGR